jgi:GNAT superfamily N-acetyltransferase
MRRWWWFGDEAIAWAEYGTPDELPTIHHRKQYLAEADVIPDYRITCIFVDKRHRGQGYAKVALAGALDLIAAQGGGVVEGYPHETGENRMNNSFVYNGTRTMYEQAGFGFVRSKGMKNTVMRRTIQPAWTCPTARPWQRPPTKEATRFDPKVIEWLLDADPAIEWQTRRDLLR